MPDETKNTKRRKRREFAWKPDISQIAIIDGSVAHSKTLQGKIATLQALSGKSQWKSDIVQVKPVLYGPVILRKGRQLERLATKPKRRRRKE